MDRIEIDPQDEINQQRQAEHEARDDDGPGIIAGVENAVDSIVRPFAADEMDEEETERQRLLNDAEQR